jgi:hypothetical protein
MRSHPEDFSAGVKQGVWWAGETSGTPNAFFFRLENLRVDFLAEMGKNAC